MNRPEILDTAKSHVTKDRQAEHGKPEDSFGLIAEFWTVYLKGRGLIPDRELGHLNRLTPVDVAQLMALLKTVRAIHNPANEDNWVDHAGYVACGGELATLQNVQLLPQVKPPVEGESFRICPVCRGGVVNLPFIQPKPSLFIHAGDCYRIWCKDNKPEI